MNYIFLFLLGISVIAGLINGKIGDVTTAMLDSCDVAVKVAFSLIGIMAFWLGMMRIAEKAGFVKFLSKLIYPFAKLLFKDIKNDSPALGDITMSISANALGLTNAATPIGLKVMKELQEENPEKETATDSMCMFLGMNTAGFQLIPATVIAILAGLGCNNPTKIILPTLIVTTLAFITAIITALIFRKLYELKESK
jgi:spore maturation protein A